MMRRLVASSRYLALIGVVFGFVACVAAFGWGSYKTVLLVARLAQGETAGMASSLVQVMDAFLIASGLLIFAVGLYELFVGELELPGWLEIHDLEALKGRLVGVIILVMAAAFVERLETHEDPREVLYSGVPVALVTAALVLFSPTQARR